VAHLAESLNFKLRFSKPVVVPGSLGGFYQPGSSFFNNAGSRDAYTAGLFHYTTKTSQVMETNSVVDIGCQFAGKTSQGVAGENRPLLR
jgi:hypothetical protein